MFMNEKAFLRFLSATAVNRVLTELILSSS